jgi:hypothetical protein
MHFCMLIFWWGRFRTWWKLQTDVYSLTERMDFGMCWYSYIIENWYTIQVFLIEISESADWLSEMSRKRCYHTRNWSRWRNLKIQLAIDYRHDEKEFNQLLTNQRAHLTKHLVDFFQFFEVNSLKQKLYIFYLHFTMQRRLYSKKLSEKQQQRMWKKYPNTLVWIHELSPI